MTILKIFISTGELSGDLHAAQIVSDIKEIAQGKKFEFTAIGGKNLEQRGVRLVEHINALSVMGVDFISKIFKIRKVFKTAVEHIRQTEPDIILLVDNTSFNIKFAETVRPWFKGKIVYYISPKIWASRVKRVYKLDKIIDRILCIFRFEPEFYAKYIDIKDKVEFVGNPITREINKKFLKNNCDDYKDKVISLLPGSRDSEIKRILPVMIKTAELVKQKHKQFRFIISCAEDSKIELIKQILKNNSTNSADFEIFQGNVYQIQKDAFCTMVTSGTATLETAYIGTPMTVLLKVAPLTAFIARRIVTIPYYSLANIVLGKYAAKEFLQEEMVPGNVVKDVLEIIENSDYRKNIFNELVKSRDLLEHNDKYAAAKTLLQITKQ